MIVSISRLEPTGTGTAGTAAVTAVTPWNACRVLQARRNLHKSPVKLVGCNLEYRRLQLLVNS